MNRTGRQSLRRPRAFLLVNAGMALVVLMATSGIVSPVYAQSRAVLAKQKKLDREARKAAKRDDYARAAELLKESLSLGELNVTYLNLGRALSHLGQCKGADEAYQAALTAPAVPRPTPEQVGKAVKKFRDELRQTCPGWLIVQCSPPDIELKIDGKPALCGEAVELSPGRHQVTTKLGERRQTLSASVESLETEKLGVQMSEPVAKELPVDEPVKSETPWLSIGLLSAGGVSLLVGTGLRVSLSDDIDEIEKVSQQPGETARYNELATSIEDGERNAFIFWGLGALLLAGGGVTWWLHASEADGEATSLRLNFGPSHVGVQGSF